MFINTTNKVIEQFLMDLEIRCYWLFMKSDIYVISSNNYNSKIKLIYLS